MVRGGAPNSLGHARASRLSHTACIPACVAPTTSANCPTSTECTFVTTAHPEGLVNVRAGVHETLSPQDVEDRFHYE